MTYPVFADRDENPAHLCPHVPGISAGKTRYAVEGTSLIRSVMFLP